MDNILAVKADISPEVLYINGTHVHKNHKIVRGKVENHHY